MKKAFLYFLLVIHFSVYSQRKIEYFHPNGEKKEVGTMVKWQKDGEWLQWNDQGKLTSKIDYVLDEKQYEEKYSNRGQLTFKIYYKHLKNYALIETYNHNGICWLNHYSTNKHNRAKISYDFKGQPGSKMAFHASNGKIHYTSLKNMIDKGFYLALPNYWWGKEGKVLTVNYNQNQLRWHLDGSLAEVKGSIENSERKIYYRWNKKGERVDNGMRPIINDTLRFDKTIIKNRLKDYYSKEGLPDGKWKNYFQNGKLWYVQEFENGVPVGVFESYFINGKLNVKATLTKGFYDGEYTEWYENGKLKMKGSLDMGIKILNWKYWAENGNLIKVENINDERLDGVFEKYDSRSGQLIESYNYVDGKKEGVGQVWYPNGNLKSFIIFKNNYPHLTNITYHANGMYSKYKHSNFNLSREYYSDGQIKSVYGSTMHIQWDNKGVVTSINYTKDKNNNTYLSRNNDKLTIRVRVDNKQVSNKLNGKFKFMESSNLIFSESLPFNNPESRTGKNIVYYPNGNVWIEESYLNGQRVGECRLWSIDGHLLKKAFYTNGVIDGESIEFDEEGRIIKKGNFVNGEKDGVWEEYFLGTIQLLSSESYNNGVSDGLWTRYDEDGNLISYRNYKNGKLDGLTKGYHYKEKYMNFSVYYKEGKRNGESKTFNKGGVMIWNGFLLDDRKHGLWIHNDDNGDLIDKQNYEYGELILPKEEGECDCNENYISTSKRGYMPLASHITEFNKLNKEIKNTIVFDSSMFKSLFINKLQYDGGYDGSTFTSFDLMAVKNIKFSLVEMPNIDIILNPCIKASQFSDNSMTVSYSNSLKSIDRGFDIEEFDFTDSSYFNLLLDMNYKDSEDCVESLIELYREVYNEYDMMGRIMGDFRAHSMIENIVPDVDTLSYLVKYADEQPDKFFGFIIDEFFSKGVLFEDTELYYQTENNLVAFFHSNLNIRAISELDNMMEDKFRADVSANQIALEFNSKLLKQWHSDKEKPFTKNDKEQGARLTFSLEHLNYTTDKGVLMDGISFVCFTESQIGDENMTIKLNDFELTKYSNYTESNLLKSYSKNTNREGVFSKNASGKILLKNKWVNIDYSDVFIRGKLLSAAVLVRNNNLETIKNQLINLFGNIETVKTEEETHLIFEYSIE